MNKLFCEILMVTIKQLRKLALAFPETEELPHFEKTSFRVAKKIFATLSEKENIVCLKLSLIDRDVFSAFDKTNIYPAPNKWGKQGWTFIKIDKIKKNMLIDLLTTAYCEVAPKILLQKFHK